MKQYEDITATSDVIADSCGVRIRIPDGGWYDISWWQIKQDGLSFWREHLSEKAWVTPEILDRLVEVVHLFMDEA